jgi:hypothetical protein
VNWERIFSGYVNREGNDMLSLFFLLWILGLERKWWRTAFFRAMDPKISFVNYSPTTTEASFFVAQRTAKAKSHTK